MSAFDIIKLPPNLDIFDPEHINTLPRPVVIRWLKDISSLGYNMPVLTDTTILANVAFNVVMFNARISKNPGRTYLTYKEAYTGRLKKLLFEHDT